MNKKLEKITDSKIQDFIEDINLLDIEQVQVLEKIYNQKEERNLKLEMLKLQLGVKEDKKEKEWFNDPFKDE